MLIRRILIYIIVFLVILLLLSCICLYQHKDLLSTYFSDSFSTTLGFGMYLLVYAVGIGLLLKAVFSR